MNKQNKIFQPKVIIGSVMSFIIAVVGVIAVFFPSLFNLEKQGMSEGKFLLSDDTKVHKELWDFLDSNQGKVVQLEIAYCADFRRMTFAATKNERNWYYEDMRKFMALDFMPSWFLGFGSEMEWEEYGVAENIEKFAKYNKLTPIYYEWLGKPEELDPSLAISITYSYVDYRWAKDNNPPILEKTFSMNYIGRPPVIAGKIASFNLFHYGNAAYPNVNGANIENGGIGFAFPQKKTFEGNEYEVLKSKDILISYPSNKNKKYIWVMGFENVVYKYLDKNSPLAKQAKSTCKAKQITESDIGEDEASKEDILKGWGGLTLGYIKGTFYIHEKEEVYDDPGLWLLTSFNEFGMIETDDLSREKFELEPFDKKDIELRKY